MNWILTKENNKFTIRQSKGKRYPRAKYSHLTNQRDLEDLVIRLNGKDPIEERTKLAVEFKHAFISPSLLDDYRLFLESRIPTRKDAGTKFTYLKRTLGYFINDLKLANPADWHKRQHIWANHLLKSKYSAKVLRETVFELNRFIGYLHQQRPEEVIPLKFEPFSRASLKTHEAKRDKRQNKWIKEWEILEPLIRNHQIYPVIMLAFCYGLRRNEVLGLLPGDVRVNYLSVERQWKGAPLKNRESRRVPHYCCTPEQAYNWIQNIPSLHPDTITAQFKILVEKAGIQHYVFHDLRRSYIRICNKIHKIDMTDLRLAVGHKDLATTSNYYLVDDRELDDLPFKPKKIG